MPSFDLILHRNRDHESREVEAARRAETIRLTANNDNDPDVQDNLELERHYRNSQDGWASEAAENERYVHNVMFTKEQLDTLAERNQPSVPINEILPAIDQGVAMMTTRRPMFRAVAREDSDVKTAKALSELVTWAWEQSLGNELLKRAIYDYYIIGRGVLQAYIDPEKDFGKGDVCVNVLNPLEVFPDPNSKDRLWRDAAHVLTSRILTKEQIEVIWPDAARLMDAGEVTFEVATEYASDRMSTEGQIFVEDVVDDYHERLRVIERYTKVKVTYNRVFEAFSGRELLFLDEEMEEYLAEPAMIVDDGGGPRVITGDEMQPFMELYERGVDAGAPNTRVFTGEPQIDPQTGQTLPPAQIIMSLTDHAGLMEMGAIDSVKIQQNRILLVITIGGILYYKGYLPVEDYPLVPLNNRHNRNPYPMSDVQFVKPLQDAINRVQALMIANLNSGTNVKIMTPRGATDKDQLEQDLGKAGFAVVEFDAEYGEPTVVQPIPLGRASIDQWQMLSDRIKLVLGIFDLMQGDASAAPPTHKGTIAVEQFGQRRIHAKLDDIEASLAHLGRVMIPMIQNLYSKEKVIRLLQPNHSVSETVVNQLQYDDFGEVIGTLNDVTAGRYDTMIVTGSTLPSNRFAELDYYRELFQEGIIDQTEVLKKTDVVDMEGVLERSSVISQLQQSLGAAQEENKKLKGDLQSAERAEINARKQAEMAKFGASLEAPKQQALKTTQLYEERHADVLKMETQLAKAKSNGSTK